MKPEIINAEQFKFEVNSLSKNALSVISRLQRKKFKAYIVGGGIRDLIKGIKPKDFSEEEILRRYLGAMINESAKVIEENMALRPSDIDVTKLYGYGFPRHRGGPMHYADTYGLNKILDDLNEFSEEDPVFWYPSQLIVDLVSSGKNFNSLNK